MDKQQTPIPPQPLDIREWSRRLPKIDLHRHFEGSLRLKTLVKIARESKIPLLSGNPETLLSEIQITDTPRDFPSFLQIFDILKRFYTSPEVIQRLTREIIIDAAEDNVRYLELRFNPQALAKTQNYKFSDVVEWVMHSVRSAQKTTGTRTCLIVQIPRNEPLAVAEEIVDIAVAYQGSFIRGIDLAGDEERFPPSIFTQPVRRAHAAGLNITVHAGEVTGEQSIHDAISLLYAQRIGHGIRAVNSPAILNLLQKRDVTLEICPTSNIKTGLVGDYKCHPLKKLDACGAHITLNTDDPSIFDTTSSQEIQAAVNKIGIPFHRIYQYLRHSVESAFIPPEERPWLRSQFRQALNPFPGAVDAFDAAGPSWI